MFTPIPYYINYQIYAYYKLPHHIIFDHNLSLLLEKKIYPLKISEPHTRFLDNY